VGTISAWSAANDAVVYPITVHRPTTFVKAWHMGNSASGNYRVGLYDSGLNLLVSSAAIANSAALHEDNITDTDVMPGRYFVATACDNATTGSFVVSAGALRWRILGCFLMASAYPLPSTLTPAAYTPTWVPMAGFSTKTVVV
jgi:hypothetical protein